MQRTRAVDGARVAASIQPAVGGPLLEEARALFAEYAGTLELDLSFQGFDAELASLPGAYAPPAGRLLVARHGDAAVGCVAVRALEPGVCELKRLYVQPVARGLGVGRHLTEAAVAEARAAGYRVMRLDTLATMASARRLYAGLGFRAIPAYRHNPLPGVEFLELDLRVPEG
ncbi:MAG: GNAT family N-acetyltransferase [Gemmatimonadota bacterium]|nr:GNAT family N-acetyltransferase [Gemmatimonadota bacterium]